VSESSAQRLAAHLGIPEPLARAARIKRLPEGAFCFRQGERARGLFGVDTGAVKLCRFGPRGEEAVLQRARPGDLFAEAAIESAAYHCHAVASEPATLAEIPFTVLRQTLSDDPAFAISWAAFLARRLRDARLRVERLSLLGAADRVRHFLLTEGSGPRCQVSVEGSLKSMALDLGMTHETLYRTLRTLSAAGEIERDGAVLRLGPYDPGHTRRGGRRGK